MITSTTDFIHFDRTNEGAWRLRSRLRTDVVQIDIEYPFTRDPRTPIWSAERQAMQQAHDAIGRWLKSQPDRAGPSDPDT